MGSPRGRSPVGGRALPVAVALLMLSLAVSGCFGGESRTGWAYEITQINDANEAGRTGAGIRVGVLDTGINVDHASLDHLMDGSDANGELKGFRDYMDNEFGLDFAHDDNGHGTHVVGIMAARGSSFTDKLLYGGIDLQGGSPNILLYVAKVCGVLDSGDAGCEPDAINRALDWMRTQEVDIVSMSLGGERTNPLQLGDATVNAVNALINTGVVVIASAGNDGPDNQDVNQPADIDGVIAVGAIQENGKVWSKSSRGSPSENTCTSDLFGQSVGRCKPNQKPEIVAPGVGILSAWAGDAYVLADGTSQATPFVTSIVALMLEGEPKIGSRSGVMALKSALINSAKPVEGQQLPHDHAAGYGIVQAADAIAAYA